MFDTIYRSKTKILIYILLAIVFHMACPKPLLAFTYLRSLSTYLHHDQLQGIPNQHDEHLLAIQLFMSYNHYCCHIFETSISKLLFKQLYLQQ